ncbi:50S ribosomal protein L25 [Patescibacteria group bacterium]
MTLKLNAEKRDAGTASSLHETGKIPAVFYGPKTDSTSIAIDKRDFIKMFREAGETTIISLAVDGKDVDVLVHEIDYDPVSDEPRHVDFYVVDKTKKVTVAIPLEFVGESLAVKNLGGTLVKILHELEVEGLPGSLPQSIEIDISTLDTLESTIAVKDVKLPEGVEAAIDADEAIAAIATQKEEEEEAPAEVDLSSIEVEKKGKEEEESTEA